MLLTQSLKNLFYPPLCLRCNEWLIREEEGLCMVCMHTLPKSAFGLSMNNMVAQVLWGRVPINYAGSFLIFNKHNLTHDILHEIKYKGNKQLAKYLGNLCASEYKEEINLQEVDMIIPIPLHPRKKRQRGFNQAAIFAMGIAENLKCQCNTTILKRRTFTSTQTKKSRKERWENVKDIFDCTSTGITNKNILLVDDVITTGATLESAAKVILQQQPKSLGILTLAYANT